MRVALWIRNVSCVDLIGYVWNLRATWVVRIRSHRPVIAKPVGKTGLAICREVAVINHRRRPHEAVAAGIEYALPGALVVAEDEELIFDDRAAQRSAKLVPMNLVGQAGEVVLRVERTVAIKLENIAMPIIGSGLGDDTHHAAWGEPVARIKVVANHAEFLGRVGIRKWCGSEIIVIDVVCAVQEIQGAALPTSIGGSSSFRRKRSVGLRASSGNCE